MMPSWLKKILLSCLVGGIVGAIYEATTQQHGVDVPSRAAKDEIWSMPQQRENVESIKKNYDLLQKHYETTAQVSQKQQQSVSFFLVGILYEGEVGTAFIAVDGKLARVSVGENLPDGTILDSISKDFIVSDRDGQKQTIRLYLEQIVETQAPKTKNRK